MRGVVTNQETPAIPLIQIGPLLMTQLVEGYSESYHLWKHVKS